MLVLITNFFSLNFTSIEIEGERVSSSQNEHDFGRGFARKRTRTNKRGEGVSQNLGIMSKRTF